MTFGEIKEKAKKDFISAYNQLCLCGLQIYDENGTPIHLDKIFIGEKE